MKMKASLLLLVVLLVLVSACGKSPSDKECLDTWLGMDWEQMVLLSAKGETSMDGVWENLEDMVSDFVSMVLNQEHSPDSVGFMVKACIERGWDWRDTLDQQIAELRSLE